MTSTIMTATDLQDCCGDCCPSTVLADPPWRFQNGTGKIAPEHRRLRRYSTMSLDQIKTLPVGAIVAPTAHLYLWVPNALLAEGLEVMAAWGFTYKANIVWHKIRKDGGPDGRGVGFYFRNVTEMVLFGVRGKNARTLAAGRRQVNLIATRKREHSRKPDELYPIIEACSPGHTWNCSRVVHVQGGQSGAIRPCQMTVRPSMISKKSPDADAPFGCPCAASPAPQNLADDALRGGVHLRGFALTARARLCSTLPGQTTKIMIGLTFVRQSCSRPKRLAQHGDHRGHRRSAFGPSRHWAWRAGCRSRLVHAGARRGPYPPSSECTAIVADAPTRGGGLPPNSP
jgi:N6-adenosine-specific RNA methylase IME4